MAARNLAEILIRAVDQTRGAFNSIRDNLRRLGSEAGRLGGILTGLGAGLSVASFAAMIKGSIDAADELNKLSQKIGISVEALSTLRFAAELSDVSLDTLQTGIKKLSQGITEASTGTGKAAEVFQALRISVTDASGAIVPTEKILLDVAEVFAGLEDGAVKSALAVELFGRSGLDLIPFLNQGADGIAALTAEAERLGLKLTTETARAAEQFNDNLTALKFSTSTLGIALAGEMLPELVNITNAMREAAKEGGILKAVFVGLGGVASVAFGSTEIQRAKEEVEGLTEKVTDLRQKVTTGKAPIPFLPFDLKFNDEALGKLKKSLAEAEGQLAAAQNRFQALVAPVTPEKNIPEGKPSLEIERIAGALSGAKKGDGEKRARRAGGDAARQELAALKAQIEGSLRLLQDANDRALRELDARLADQTISLQGYYAERVRLEQGAVDAEIAALEQQHSAAGQNAAERGRLETEIGLLRRKRADVSVQAAREEIEAEQKLTDIVIGLRARLAEAQGRPLEARRAQIEQEIKSILDQFPGQVPEEIIKLTVQLRGAENARAEFEDLQRQLQEIEERRHLREQSVQAETETGLFGEFEQRSRLIDVYQETAAAVDGLLPKLRELAAAHPELPEISRAVTQAETDLAELKNSSSQISLELGKQITEGFSSAFSGFIRGAKSAKEAFADFGASILDSLSQIAAQGIAKSLFGSLFGGGESGQGGGFFGLLAKLFHGGGIVGAGGGERMISAIAFAGAPSFQRGGLVGLRSNEVPAILERGEEVLTRDDPRHRANAQAQNVTVVMNVTTQDAQSFRKSQGQIMADLTTGISRARSSPSLETSPVSTTRDN